MLNIKDSNHWPLIGMIHTGSNANHSSLELAQREIEIYLRNGIYPLIENYFGSVSDCEMILEWIQANHPDAVYGVNILGDYRESFRLANKYRASFLQIDSVCGHLSPENDEKFAEELQKLRKTSKALVLGGVRFKYQPVRSGRTLRQDLLLGTNRCDAIVCTGEGTGIPTPIGKVKEFKTILPEFPIIVGAGVILDTMEETFFASDGAIVGSWMKNGHRDIGEVNESYVEQLTGRISTHRIFHNIFGGISMCQYIRKNDIVYESSCVSFWRKELSCAVTVTFGNVLSSLQNCFDWKICIICEGYDHVEHYINLSNVESLSSGVRFRGIANVPGNYSAAIYDISPEYIKQRITIPDDPFVGFPWYDSTKYTSAGFDAMIPKVIYPQPFEMNFVVCGEFNAGIFMFNPLTREIKNLFYTSFCCK